MKIAHIHTLPNGDRYVNIRLDEGVIINGFLWTTGGQLKPPMKQRGDDKWAPMIAANPVWWRRLRKLFIDELGITKSSHTPQDNHRIQEHTRPVELTPASPIYDMPPCSDTSSKAPETQARTIRRQLRRRPDVSL